MGASNLLPLVVLFAVVGGVAYVGYQVSYAPGHIHMWTGLLTYADLPVHKRTRRAWRPQAGEEERCLHQGRRKSWRKRSQCGEICGQDTAGVCKHMERCTRRVGARSVPVHGVKS
jgi:hypothetical protein